MVAKNIPLAPKFALEGYIYLAIVHSSYNKFDSQPYTLSNHAQLGIPS